MSRMHNPAHPGEVLREWLPEDMTVTQAAGQLQVSRVMLSKILNCKAGVSADMAIRLARVFGGAAESWLYMQANYDLWQAERRAAQNDKRLRLAA